MPQLEEALSAYLIADDGVSSYVGDRVYPVRLPEGTVLPAIAWQRISSQRAYTYDDFADTNPFVTARVQFACWATTALESIRIGEAILLALSGYEGDMSGQPIGSSFAVTEVDTYESETKLFRRLLDFFISYEDDIVVGS